MIAELARCFSDLGEPPGLIWLLTLILAAVFTWRRKWSGALALAGLALFQTLIGATPLARASMASLERPYSHSSPKDLPACDAVVMLGGTHSLSAHDVFGFELWDSADRVLTALELMREHKGKTLVVGGGMVNMDGQFQSCGVQLQKWFTAWGIPGAPVLVLQGANNTHAEAEKVLELVKSHNWERIILVTSAFHMRRSEALFKKAGISLVTAPCDFRSCGVQQDNRVWSPVPRTANLQNLSLYLHEEFGWLLYRWKGWVQ